MVHRFRVIAAAALLAGYAVACSTKDAALESIPEPATAANPSLAEPPPPPAIVGERLVVFGLSLPSDLEPGTAAPGVYRFEGPYPAVFLSTLVAGQVNARPADEPGGAKFFRKVRARKPEAPLISSRIGPLGTSRAYIDLWLETDPSRGVRSPAGQGAGQWVSGRAEGLSKAQARGGEMERRKERREAAMLAAEKAAKGTPLTPKEQELIH
jgi:hypothetical protein